MSLPPTPAPGASILAWARRAAEWMRSQRLVAGPGILLRSSSSGTVISARNQAFGATSQTMHPFKIVGSLDESEDPQITVNYGQIIGWSLQLATDGNPMLQAVHLDFLVYGNDPLNHPTRTTVGQQPLTAEFTYGVWLRGTRSTSNTVVLDDGTGLGYKQLFATVGNDWQIIVDTTDVTPTSKQDDADYIHVFLGTAGYIDGAWEIVQYRKSDLSVPFGTLPVLSASADEGNSFSLSPVDGLPFVPPIVSADTGNQITPGSDGGAFAVVVDPDSGNDISGSGTTGAYYETPP